MCAYIDSGMQTHARTYSLNIPVQSSFMIKKKKKNAIIPECVLKYLCVEQILLSQLLIGVVSSSEHLVSLWKSTLRKTFVV